MAIFSSVRRTGRWDCSTKRMISSFSEAECLIPRLPHPRSCFFSNRSSSACSATTSFNSCAWRRSSLTSLLVAHAPYRRQPALASLKELLRPTVITAPQCPRTSGSSARSQTRSEGSAAVASHRPYKRPSTAARFLAVNWRGGPGADRHAKRLDRRRHQRASFCRGRRHRHPNLRKRVTSAPERQFCQHHSDNRLETVATFLSEVAAGSKGRA